MAGRVEIRIRNASGVDFDEVHAHFPDGHEVDYGSVPSGGITGFRAVSRAYRFAGISVRTGGRELSLQPMDYMGERELPAGRYTYALAVDQMRLTQKLEEAGDAPAKLV